MERLLVLDELPPGIVRDQKFALDLTGHWKSLGASHACTFSTVWPWYLDYRPEVAGQAQMPPARALKIAHRALCAGCQAWRMNWSASRSPRAERRGCGDRPVPRRACPKVRRCASAHRALSGV